MEEVLTDDVAAPALDLAVCLNAYSGHSLESALLQVRETLRWSAVELDAIDGLFCHVDLERVREADYRRDLERTFSEYQVQCRAVSAQRPAVDGLDTDGIARMTGLFELTRQLGADRIILGAGRNETAFRRNIATLLEVADDLDLMVGLETQGPRQLVHDAGCRRLLESIGSQRLDVNYDFGNCFFALDGRFDMLADFLALAPLVGHAHFKDGEQGPDGHWRLTPIAGGIVDYRALMAAMTASPVPVSIELPRRMVLETGTRRDAVPTLAQINHDLAASLQNVIALWPGTLRGGPPESAD